MYTAVWPGHQKMNLKCGEILNQKVRKDITVCKRNNPHTETDEDTMKSVTSI